MIDALGAYLGVCLLLAMVPGPGAMVVIRQATMDGRKSAFLTLLGNETALILWGVAAACGLTALIAASQVAYDVIRLVGAGVLVALGVQALVGARRRQSATTTPTTTTPAAAAADALAADASASDGTEPSTPDSAALRPLETMRPRPRSARRSYWTGIVTNITNPKAGIFAMSFLPQFVPHGAPAFPALLTLAVLWAVVDAAWFTMVIWGIGKARTFFTRTSVWRRITQISGVVLIALGVTVAANAQ